MIPINEIDIKIKIPGGYLVRRPTGETEDYPGIGIFFSEDGVNVNWNNLVSITEYNSTFNNIQTVGYKKNDENYVALVRFEDGDICQD